MPFISDTQLARVQSKIQSQESKFARAKKKAEEKAGEMKLLLEVAGAAAAMGFVRGKVEKDGSSFTIPNTTIDIELVAGLGICGAAFFDLFGKYDADVLNAGAGIMAHYAGQMARNFGKTDQFSLVAGDAVGMLPQYVGALPQYNQLSYNPTQQASPYADPVAAALARSGV